MPDTLERSFDPPFDLFDLVCKNCNSRNVTLFVQDHLIKVDREIKARCEVCENKEVAK